MMFVQVMFPFKGGWSAGLGRPSHCSTYCCLSLPHMKDYMEPFLSSGSIPLTSISLSVSFVLLCITSISFMLPKSVRGGATPSYHFLICKFKKNGYCEKRAGTMLHVSVCIYNCYDICFVQCLLNVVCSVSFKKCFDILDIWIKKVINGISFFLSHGFPY